MLPELIETANLSETLDMAIPARVRGTVWSVDSNCVEARGLAVPVGAVCKIERIGQAPLPAQVIGFRGEATLLASLDGTQGIAPGCAVHLEGAAATIRVGRELQGRVIDASGTAIDGGKAPACITRTPLDRAPIPAMQRPPITQPLVTGVRAIDSMLTLGVGQRIGIFAGSGVGKSTLLGMIARGTDADVVVIGLVGERGREVQEYLQRELSGPIRKKCVTVVATSDQPALRRVQAAHTSTSIAEYYRDQGKNVLLMMDSVTRFAMAQREIGLAAGEAPTTRGYPPSVFSMLPRLVERSGLGPKGSITGIYTVLVEGDDTNEPISDTLRGLLDGHIVLSRDIAQSGRYPAINITSSLSRLQAHIVAEDHLKSAAQLRKLLAIYQDNLDLISIGAYQRGTSPEIDLAIAMNPAIEQFLAQPATEKADWKNTVARLREIFVAQPVPANNLSNATAGQTAIPSPPGATADNKMPTQPQRQQIQSIQKPANQSPTSQAAPEAGIPINLGAN